MTGISTFCTEKSAIPLLEEKNAWKVFFRATCNKLEHLYNYTMLSRAKQGRLLTPGHVPSRYCLWKRAAIARSASSRAGPYCQQRLCLTSWCMSSNASR